MFQAVTTEAPATTAALLIVPVFAGRKPGPGAAEVARTLKLPLKATLEAADFSGEPGDELLLPGLGRIAADNVLFVGLGSKITSGAIRSAAHRAGVASRPFASVASTLAAAGADPVEDARAFAEGLLLGRWRDDTYKSVVEDPVVALDAVSAIVPKATAAIRSSLSHGRIHADAANWARDLVDQPSSECTPAAMAAVARSMARSAGLTCTVWTDRDLAKGGFGGVLGVGKGGANPPRMVELRYEGGRGKPIALTGKGITFDSGGLDIKKAKWMETMKVDMAGAAAMLAVMRALPELELKVNVIAAIAFAENLVSGSAQHPGDVITHRGGKTSEVVDTDAEGRVLLADVLSYLSEGKPREIIDCATLTGTGLGEDLWAIMGTDQRLVDDLRAAGDAAGEPGWQFPLVEAYTRHTDSDIADIKNADWEGADTLASGLFLRFFTNGVPWAHLDVGDTAFLEAERAEWAEGATGSPARVILRYLEAQAGR